MSSKYALHAGTAALMITLLWGMCGCSAFYYKEFVIGGTPHNPITAFRSAGILYFIIVDAKPDNKETLRDSSYQVELSVLRGASETCDDSWEDTFGSVALERFAINLDNGSRFVPENAKRERPSACWINWEFEPVVIPGDVDRISIELLLSYERNAERQVLDTSVVLVRQEGSERGPAMF